MKNSLLLTVCLSVLSSAAVAQTAAPVTEDAVTVADGFLLRNMSLSDLGYRDGVTFRQLAGDTTLYFPVRTSGPIQSGRLTLNLQHGATNDVNRFLQVSIGNRIVASQALPTAGGALTLELDVTAADVQSGFVAVRLSYSGAFSDYVCVDERASGDFVQILPESHLALRLTAAEIATPSDFIGFRPAQVYVQLPSANSQAGLAAAIRAATLFGGEAGGVSFGTKPLFEPSETWAYGAVALDVTNAGAASEMTVAQDGGRPTLHVRGTDPQLGLWQMSSAWAGLADATTAVTQAIGTQKSEGTSISLSALGADMGAQDIISSGQFLIPFKASDLPAGMTASGLELLAISALDPQGRGATASVYLNDTLLGNRPLDTGLTEHLKFSIPKGLISGDNLLRVSVMRQASGGECRFKPQGYPAQVLPGSKLTLTEAPNTGENFFELRQAFASGAQVVVTPDVTQTYAELMPWLSGIMGAMIPDQATIIARNTLADVDATVPFVIVSNSNPSDTDPLITLDKGRVEISDRDGNLMFDGADLAQLGIVQIISRNGAYGLWVKPGEGEAPVLNVSKTIALDRGNLALIGAEGVVVVTSTVGNSLLDVVYPDQVTYAQIFDRYRPWIVGGFWLILTVLTLMVFQKLYRRRRSSSTDA